MTSKQINLAIAEFTGEHDRSRYYLDGIPCHSDPDYFGDLNAMHSAEATLTYDQACAYTNLLAIAVSGQEVSETPSAHLFPHCATSAHRSEALLKTLNLWQA